MRRTPFNIEAMTTLAIRAKSFAALLMLAGAPVCLSAQSPATGTRGETTLTAEALAVGVRYSLRTDKLGVGAELVAGPQFAVALNDDHDDSRNWAGAYATLQLRVAGGVHVLASPIGVALVRGNDYTAAYPSAQFGIDYGKSRLSVGTLARVVRVPLANSEVQYRASWVPLRVSYRPK